jgi:3-hydroxyisobutyrate dehydrogenase-like beta-hydroxyacid dehydrogenase
MVVDGPQVEEILLGEDGAASGAEQGTLFVDCSTIGPAEAVKIGTNLRERGFGFLDAPVTGSSPRAEDGTLTFMVGGDPDEFERVRPALETMGKLIVHAGALGQGQVVKVLNNALAAINATAIGQALLVGARAGADLDALIKVAAAGSGGSAMLGLKAEPMRTHDYTTFFKLDHMLKDVRLCLEQAHTESIPFPFAEETATILAQASEMGHGDDDFASLIEALQEAAGTRL